MQYLDQYVSAVAFSGSQPTGDIFFGETRLSSSPELFSRNIGYCTCCNFKSGIGIGLEFPTGDA